MKEIIYNFLKGENTDFGPENQPKDTYRKGRNIIRKDTGQIISERGHTVFENLSGTFEVLGHYNLNGELILCLVNGAETQSEIGILEADGTYTAYISNRSASSPTLLLSSNKLAFKKANPVDIEARKLFDSDRVIYFVDGLNDDKSVNLNDLPDDAGFLEETKLQFSFKMPIVKLNEIISGSLPTGVYQFTARYLTEGGEATSTGILTDPIYIVDEDQGVGRANLDGALPQATSSKGIELNLTHLDLIYPFLEVIAVTYLGTANTPQYSIVSRVDNVISERTFEYLDIQQNINDILQEEITVRPVIYEHSKHIEQKDGMLFRSNLLAESIDIDFQSIANNVKLEYFVKKLDVDDNIDVKVNGQNWTSNGALSTTPSFTFDAEVVDTGSSSSSFEDYKNEKVASTQKGYMRNEVYSFALAPIFKGGSIGFAYHIPGNNTVNTPANTTTKRLGTYVSTEDYPIDQGYPSGKVRHHLMPRIDQEPIVELNGTTSYGIRILGIRAENIIIPANIKDKLQGILILRQRRNKSSNRTVVAQGIGKRFFEIFNNLGGGGTAVNLANIPGYGKTILKSEFSTVADNTKLNSNIFSFYSPDIIHKLVTNFNFNAIQKNQKYIHSRKYDTRFTFQENLPRFSFDNIQDIDIIYTNPNSIDLIPTFTEITPFSLGTGETGDFQNKNINLPFSSLPYAIKSDSGHIVLSTESEEPPIDWGAEEEITSGVRVARVQYAVGESPVQLTTELLTLRNEINNVYGAIDTANYIPCDTIIFGEDRLKTAGIFIIGETLDDDEAEFYSGDIFINKYALVIGDSLGNANNSVLEFFASPVSRALLFFPLESLGNYNYRHYIDTTIEEEGTLPYYPKYKILQSLSSSLGIAYFPNSIGHSTNYNKQYSFENIITDYVPKPLLFQEQTLFPNRIIRSNQTFEGEIGDSYRIFLPNNFQDLPKNKGDITNLFVWNKILYIHTVRSLFRTFVNSREQIITDASQIVIGTGGVFSQPSEEIFDINGGYVGTSSKYAGILTPFGYYFTDNTRGKVFELKNSLREVSNQGQFDFFRNSIDNLQDSPLENIGFVGGYDYLNERVLITKLGIGGFTKSYAVKLDSWTGEHDYQPVWYIDLDKKLLLYKEGIIYEANIGERGKFLGETARAEVEMEFSMNIPFISKVYDNLFLRGKTIKRNGILNADKFFDKIQVYTSDQNSDLLNIIISDSINPVLANNEIKATYRAREYRLSIPLDAVIDNSLGLDIFNPTNINLDKLFKGRIVNDFAICKLVYTNDEDDDLILDLIKLFYRPEII